ncbi:MAG: alpha/beta hydrolase [Burkholderiaceae bacterium]|nr:MAG: alpha/beta hydrolase [Burkholderiaceae bacterium]
MQDVGFLLIPGAGGSAWYWHLVEQDLRQRGYGAIPVALPAADDSAGLADYAAAVVSAVGKRKPRRLVLVAHSLGGFTAPLVCKQLPVSLLVMVNAMIPNPGETPGTWWRDTGYNEAKIEQNRRDGRDADAPFDPLFEFFHDVPQPVIDEAWAQGEPRQSDAVFNSKCDFARWPAIPIRVLVGRDDRFFPAEFQKRVAHERLGVSADEMPGGHLVALSHPVELSQRLIAYAEASRTG